MVQKGEGIRERLRSYSLEIRSKVTPGFWKPKFVTHLSTPSEGGLRSRGREEFGDVVGDSCLGRQYLLLIDQGFDPVTIPFPVIFSHTITWPKNLGHNTVQLGGLTISPVFLL